MAGGIPSATRFRVLIDKYLFRQMRPPALWAVAALFAVGMLSQSLSGLELMVEQRQSAWVFAKITLLAMPQLLSLILPLALFVAALITLNRLQSEQEIIVAYAGGVSRWRVISPMIRLSVYAALAALIINLWVDPWSSRTMRAELNAARADLAATLVREGQFTQPAAGLTVYAQEVGAGGALRNLFIHQEDPKTGAITYTAREGRLTKRGDSPVLIMENGASQSFTRAGVLNFLAFDDYVFDLAPFMGGGPASTPRAGDRYIRELFFPDPADEWAEENRGKLLAEGHSRISSPLYNLTFMALALSAVLGGGFSRLGYGKRIAVFSGVAVFVRIIGFVVQALCEDAPALNGLQYAVPMGVFAGAVLPFLWARPRRPRQRRPVLAGATA